MKKWLICCLFEIDILCESYSIKIISAIKPIQFNQYTLVTYPKGFQVCKTYARVQYVHFLRAGTLSYLHINEASGKRTLLYLVSDHDTPVGWNGLVPPGRYTCDVEVYSEQAEFVRLTQDEFLQQMNAAILSQMGSNLYRQLMLSLYKQYDLSNSKVRLGAAMLESYFVSSGYDVDECVALLKRSPFFGGFQDDELYGIAEIVRRRDYEPGELIHNQDEHTSGICVLIQGEVSLRRLESKVYLELRSISTPGYIFGWSSVLGAKDLCRATAERKTSVYFIPGVELAELIDKDDFGVRFYKMIIWLLGNQLQLSHSRFLNLLSIQHLESVRHLINVNRPKLPLNSCLHQISHLLKDISTKPMAFDLLHSLIATGTAQEQHIASICLDLLSAEEHEVQFMQRIGEVYETVAQSSPDRAADNRLLCAQQVKKVFEKTNYHIEGLDNLPDEGGNIFIYNHLLNDPHYTLNNLFQLTLDSHFLSAMLLYDKYGDPGMRTVRFGKSMEYGHQDYYENLGYISVFTMDSDIQEAKTKEEAKDAFYKNAIDWIDRGGNLIISPEGSSYVTEESPGPFKMGPFNLAVKAKKEPKIVPVILCNFDKRITNTLLYCEVLKPFKISEKIKEGQSLKDFVQAYQREFAQAVRQAIGQSEELLLKSYVKHMNLPESPEIWTEEISQLKAKVSMLEEKEDVTVFYGSSSIRLWDTLEEDLSPHRVINLGFGGSTYLWCSYYFEEVFEGLNPSRIILYAGDNDLSQSPNPQLVIKNLITLLSQIELKYKFLPITLMTVKPSPDREYLTAEIKEFNQLLNELALERSNVTVIDIYPAMLDSKYATRPELFVEDGLHMNRGGYEIWARLLKHHLDSSLAVQ